MEGHQKIRPTIKRHTAMASDRVEDLEVYRTAFRASMVIFEHSEQWSKVEQYVLTDQIRRSFRAVCANLSEAWRMRRYPKSASFRMRARRRMKPERGSVLLEAVSILILRTSRCWTTGTIGLAEDSSA